MPLGRETDTFASVASWRAGLRAQWGGDPLAEDPSRLASLADFCAFAGMDPDALLAFCFLRKRDTGERFASAARRAELADRLRAWVAERGLAGAASRRASADVLSFLIHNGVMMNAGAAHEAPGPAGPTTPSGQPA